MLNHKHRHIIIALSLMFYIINDSSYAFQGPIAKPVYHQVIAGETLYNLSARYQTSVEQLKYLNQMSDDLITRGNRLIVGHEVITPDSTGKKEEQSLYNEITMRVDRIAASATRKTRKSKNATSFKSIDSLFNRIVSEDSRLQNVNNLNLEKIKALNNDLGLRLIGGYTRNFAPEILNAEESFFNSWVSGGANLEILNGGFIGNKMKAEEIRAEIGINELNQVKSVKKENYPYLYNFLLYSFNKAKYKNLEDRERLITDFLELSSKLYYLRGISWEEIIQWKSELEQTKEALKKVDSYNQVFADNYDNLNFGSGIEADQLPILEIHLDQLMKDIAIDSVGHNLLNLHRKRLALKYRKNSDLSLQAQFKFNALTGQSNGRSRAYGSFRLSLSAPLFKNKRNQQLQEKEIAIVEHQLTHESSTINNEVMNLYYEYQYILKDFIATIGKKEQLRERMRQGNDRQVLNESDHTPISTLAQLKDMYAIEFELIDIKQRLYLQLLKIYTISNATSLGQFTIPTDLQTSFNKTNDQRAVYLWSNNYEELGQNFLLSYLDNNDINRVMFSPGSQASGISEFLKKVVNQDKKIYRLIGENSYAKKGFTTSLKQKIENLDPLFEGIHLDVEPQALQGWDDNKAHYLRNFIDVLHSTRLALPKDKALSVSIPVFFPTFILKQTFELADEVVVMAYGNTNASEIKRKLSEELSIIGADQKLTIALRASDFNDRIEMEELIDVLITELDIDRFIIQDLGDLVSLDQKTILGDLNSRK